jgi:Retroviral aspartyl protease
MRLKGKEIQVMMNSRVIRNYISLECVKKCYIKTYNKDKSYKLALADRSPAGQTRWMNIKIILITLNIQKHQETLVLNVINIKYDIILGIPWLEYHDLVVSWKAKTLAFTNYQCEGSIEEEIPFIKAI